MTHSSIDTRMSVHRALKKCFHALFVYGALMTCALAAPPVTVTTLDGETLEGELNSITAEQLAVAEKKVAIDQVTTVEFENSFDPETSDKLGVRLLDGSHLSCKQATTSGNKLKLQSTAYGEMAVPLSKVVSVRFLSDARLLPEWEEFHNKQQKRDLLVIRKKDGSKLDHSPGVVASIAEANVSFVLGGDEIPLKRERIFGVVFSRTKDESQRANVRVTVGKRDRLMVREITVRDDKANIELMGGVECEVPVTQLAAIDLSSDKIVYLSSLEPRKYEFVPFFGESEVTLFRYRRDETEFRRPIRLAGKTYKRGLSIHSKTTLLYRISKDYRRFQAVMGIDYDRVRRKVGHVQVVISGDGKALFNGEVDHKDEPISLDLNVTGVRELEILVDYGKEKVTTSTGEEKSVLSSMGDWLNLANARVIK